MADGRELLRLPAPHQTQPIRVPQLEGRCVIISIRSGGDHEERDHEGGNDGVVVIRVVMMGW